MPSQEELFEAVDALLEGEPRLPSPAERARLREAAGVTQARLAAALKSTPQTVKNWENGRSEPRPPRLQAYLRLLDGWAERYPAPAVAPAPAPVPEAFTGPVEQPDQHVVACRATVLVIVLPVRVQLPLVAVPDLLRDRQRRDRLRERVLVGMGGRRSQDSEGQGNRDDTAAKTRDHGPVIPVASLPVRPRHRASHPAGGTSSPKNRSCTRPTLDPAASCPSRSSGPRWATAGPDEQARQRALHRIRLGRLGAMSGQAARRGHRPTCPQRSG